MGSANDANLKYTLKKNTWWSACIPSSGKRYHLIISHSHGKSPCLIGKPSINGQFSMAMLNNQRVNNVLKYWTSHRMFFHCPFSSAKSRSWSAEVVTLRSQPWWTSETSGPWDENSRGTSEHQQQEIQAEESTKPSEKTWGEPTEWNNYVI